eukprot:TRINITY_DN4708_c0_g4_i1.p1 TRINITY_DN4708_c0_g4~~TRINITY_DN4708_c0_g4_i1.p1  ORF type:complete len:410 (-),score=71.26 TRINITY_DN4708_c0_g4_i1:905-2089(-)
MTESVFGNIAREEYNAGARQRFTALIPKDLLKSLSPQEIQRQEVIFELVITERLYIKDLSILMLQCITPLKSNKILTTEESASLFANLEALFQANKDFFNDMKKRVRESDPTIVSEIGDILNAHDNTFRLYSVYCSNHPFIPTLLETLTKQKPQFAAFVKECEASLSFRGLHLTDFLIKPLQRILKYPLLFKAILQSTPEAHKDFANVKKSLDKILLMVDSMNEKNRQVENLDKLNTIQNSLHASEEEMFNLVSHSRIFIMEGKSTMIHNKHSKEVTVYLFNDLLLITKQKHFKKDKVILRTHLGRLSLKDVSEEFSSYHTHLLFLQIMLTTTTHVLCSISARKQRFETREWTGDHSSIRCGWIVFQFDRRKRKMVRSTRFFYLLFRSPFLKRG